MADTTLPIAFGGANTDIYIHRLRAQYVGVRLWNPDIALARDPDIFGKMLRDPTIRQAIEGRQRRAAGTSWTIEPPRRATDEDEKLAPIVEDGLSEIRCFQESRYTLSTALLRGNRFAYVKGERISRKLGEDSVKREWWMPTELVDIDGRRFRWIPDTGIRNGLRNGTWDPGSKLQIAPVGIRDNLWNDVPTNIPLVWVRFNDEEGRLRYGRGLAETLYHIFWAKMKITEEYLAFIEKWGQGVVVGKIGSMTKQNMRDQSFGQATGSLVNKWIDMIDRMRARNAVVFDEQDDLQVIFPGGGAQDVFVRALGYFDNAITKLVDGALLPSGGGAKQGSLARGKVEEDTVEQISQLDRRIVDAALTERLVGWFLRMNRPLIAASGCKDARRPLFRTAQEKKADPTIMIDKYVKIHAMGAPIPADKFYEDVAVPRPNPGDELLIDVVKEVAPDMLDKFLGISDTGDESTSPEGSTGNQPKNKDNQPKIQKRGSTTSAKGPGAKARV